MEKTKIRTIFFDFMGTCLDWHSGATKALPDAISQKRRSHLALEWRHDYFDSNAARLAANEPPEDIDITLRNTLDALLERYPEDKDLFHENLKHDCVKIWHSMPAWSEVFEAINKLKTAGYEVIVFANGTTRLQLDLCQSSGLQFDMLLSSELLGVYKPAPESYEKTLRLVRRRAEETVMVAAHTADLLGAKKAGMKTVYIHRWTDDIKEDQKAIKEENDCYLEDMTNLADVIMEL